MRTSSELNLILAKKYLLLLHIFASAQKPILLTLMFGLYQDRFLCVLTLRANSLPDKKNWTNSFWHGCFSLMSQQARVAALVWACYFRYKWNNEIQLKRLVWRSCFREFEGLSDVKNCLDYYEEGFSNSNSSIIGNFILRFSTEKINSKNPYITSSTWNVEAKVIEKAALIHTSDNYTKYVIIIMQL